MNRYCTEQLRRIGAKWGVFALESSPENMKELAKVSPLPLVQVISARPPLFTSAVCVRQNSCEQCTGGTKTYKLEKDGKTYSAVSKKLRVWTDILPRKTIIFRKAAQNEKKGRQDVVLFYGCLYVIREKAKKSTRLRVLFIWLRLLGSNQRPIG